MRLAICWNTNRPCKKNIDRYKGSEGYDDDLKMIQEDRKKADDAARAVCKPKVEAALHSMIEVNSKRKATAPTEEQLRLLTAVSMIKKPSRPMLDSIANAMDGNAVGLSVLDDIAENAYKDGHIASERFTTNYAARATKEMSVDGTLETIRALSNTCNRIMNGSGANHIRERLAEKNKQHYGSSYDPDDLPQEKPWESDREFYEREMNGLNMDLFSKAVNSGS